MTTRKWLIPLAVLSVVWGASFLFIEVGLRELTPLQVALARVLLGAATIAVVLAVSRTPLPSSRRMWGHIAVVAVTFNVIPFILFAWAQTHISSVLAGIWNATTPLWTVPTALLLIPSTRLDRRRLLGLLLGFCGVVVVLGPWDVDLVSSEVVLGSVACLAATACYGFSVTYMSRFLADGAGISLVGGQLIVATTVLAFITLPIDSPPTQISGVTVLAMLGLGVLGTGIAYVLMYRLVRTAGPTTASTVTYLTPLVSTTLGVLVLDERITWHEPLGGAVVLLGVWLSRQRVQVTDEALAPPPRAPQRG